MKRAGLLLLCFLSSTVAFADVSLTDRATVVRAVSQQTGGKLRAHKVPPEELAARRAANLAKKELKRSKRRGNGAAGPIRAQSARLRANATGSMSLIDASGLQYFINTDITFSTSSSASGAASEASFTAPIVASTSAGGTTTSTLDDMFDGYNTICVSFTGSGGPCQTGDVNYSIYNQAGPATLDTSVPATPSCTGRQIVTPTKTIGALSVYRKVFVPNNDQFIRWADVFTNTSAAPVTFRADTGNNLGSDSNTVIVSSSDGDTTAQLTDTWVSTFQNFTNGTSSDPRIGHVLQGTGAPTPLSSIHFADGDDNPYWGYTITLAPGQTKIILNFATGQGTKASANAKAAQLASLPASSTQCLSATELSQVTNFAVGADLAITKSTTPSTTVNAGQAITYTLNVTNNGPSTATSVSVTDVLPAGVVYGSATGTGWTCNFASGTVTCTMPSLAAGPASPITINATAPLTGGSSSNTATVSSATNDPNAANNGSTSAVTVVASADLSILKTASSPTGYSSSPFTFTLAVTNGGPSVASNVTVTDTLASGTGFVSATGSGWTCSAPSNVVTCTRPTLAVGAAPAISLVVAPPAVSFARTLVNTASVSSTTPDPSATNNSSTVTVNVLPSNAIPTLSTWMLLLLAALLGVAGIFRRG